LYQLVGDSFFISISLLLQDLLDITLATEPEQSFTKLPRCGPRLDTATAMISNGNDLKGKFARYKDLTDEREKGGYLSNRKLATLGCCSRYSTTTKMGAISRSTKPSCARPFLFIDPAQFKRTTPLPSLNISMSLFFQRGKINQVNFGHEMKTQVQVQILKGLLRQTNTILFA
jgi:hypothetical protein